jgi:hypothetical protein
MRGERNLMLRSVYHWACRDDERWPGQAPACREKTGHGTREAAATECGEECGKASSAQATCFLMNHDLT